MNCRATEATDSPNHGCAREQSDVGRTPQRDGSNEGLGGWGTAGPHKMNEGGSVLSHRSGSSARRTRVRPGAPAGGTVPAGRTGRTGGTAPGGNSARRARWAPGSGSSSGSDADWGASSSFSQSNVSQPPPSCMSQSPQLYVSLPSCTSLWRHSLRSSVQSHIEPHAFLARLLDLSLALRSLSLMDLSLAHGLMGSSRK